MPGYPHVLISNYGRVWNSKTERWITISWRRGSLSEKIAPKISITDKSLKYFKKTVNLKPLVKKVWPRTEIDWTLLM